MDFKHKEVTPSPLRPRVTKWTLHQDYIAKYLAENYFTETIDLAIKVRNFIRDKFGYTIDYKARCPMFGKKHKAKKAQMRAVLDVFAVYILVILFVSIVSLTWITLTIIECLCFRSKPA